MKKIRYFLILLCLVGCQPTPVDSAHPVVSKEEAKVEARSEVVEEEILTVETAPTWDILFSSERGGDRDLYLGSLSDLPPVLLLDLPSIEGHGDWHPNGFQIVFFSDMDGDRDLYTIDLRDSPLIPIQLTNSPGMDHLPDWSPDGEHIVFESGRNGQPEIYIMEADGSNQKRLTQNKYDDKAPTFSPDGKTIGFTTWVQYIPYFAAIPSFQESMPIPTIYLETTAGYVDWSDEKNILICHAKGDVKSELYTLNITNQEKVLLLDDPGKTLWVPVFSPDGNWIAYDTESSFGTGEIFVKSLNSDQIYQLTDHPSSDWGPDWRPSPQYEIILFDSNIDGDREIYSRDLHTNITTQLTDNNSEDGLPSWSPDGQQIVFFSDRDGDDEIFVMNADGSDVTQLTFNEYDDRTPAWSNGGDLIAYASLKNGNYDIFIMDLTGGNTIQLTSSPIKEFWPTWDPDDLFVAYTHFGSTQDTYQVNVTQTSEPTLFKTDCSRIAYSPDGEMIAYSSKQNGNWDIYTMTSEGTRSVQISFSRSDEWVPTWTPDSKEVIFARESSHGAALIKIHTETYEIKGIEPNNSQNWRPIFKPIH